MVDARDGSAVASAPSAGVAEGPDPLIGRVVNDRYTIHAMIARGGMGRVYRGVQAPLGRQVALKILHPNYKGENDPDFHRRFFLEASTCAKLTHPNTVTIFDYGRTEDDVYYIAMELLEGRTLHRALREDGPMPPGRALHIARQVCRSLREAHSIHVVHRDLKPANVFLCSHDDDPDFVKVLDFGLVKNTEDTAEDLTQTGLFMGSPKYMAPEQIQGEKADGRVDIYALGVILYEMLTGKVPFDRANSVNILMAHVHDAPPSFEAMNPEVQIPPHLEALVMKCLAKNPAERFATMEQLLLAMKEIGESGQHSLSSGSLSSKDLLVSSSEVSVVTHLHGTPSFTPSGVVARTSSVSLPAAAAIPLEVPVTFSSQPPPPARKVPVWAWAAGAGLALAVVAGGLFAMQGGTGTAETGTIGTGTIGTGTIGTGTGGTGTGGTGTGATGTTGTGTSATDTTGTGTTGTGTTGTGTTGTGTTAAGTGDPTGSGSETSPAQPRVELTLSSTPPGASVRVGEHRYGPTPVTIVLEGEEAARGNELTLVFSLAGHQMSTVRRTVEGETLTVDVSLARRAAGMAGGDVTHVEGYRDDPY